MSKRKDTVVIQDIKEAIERIISYISRMEYDDFLHDYKTQDAVIRTAVMLDAETKSRRGGSLCGK